MVSPTSEGSIAQFVTLEQGTYAIDTGIGDDPYFFKSVFSRVEPLASSRLVIGNEFSDDLPDSLRAGDEVTRQITRAGERLGALDLLPAAFPIEEILSDRDLRHVKLLYGIGGLSYGNVSARRLDVEPGETQPQYWMSASGVDKSALHEIGRDILLVTGYDEARDVMQLRVPAGVEPRRVSVDAIEHWMIYREHPEVNAILHVHVDRGHRRHRDQLPVRHRRARRVGRRARAPGPRSQPRRRRPAQSRPHHHRPHPRRDLRPHRRQDRSQSPHGLTTDGGPRIQWQPDYVHGRPVATESASAVRNQRSTRCGSRVHACHVIGNTRHRAAANSARRARSGANADRRPWCSQPSHSRATRCSGHAKSRR